FRVGMQPDQQHRLVNLEGEQRIIHAEQGGWPRLVLLCQQVEHPESLQGFRLGERCCYLREWPALAARPKKSGYRCPRGPAGRDPPGRSRQVPARLSASISA